MKPMASNGDLHINNMSYQSLPDILQILGEDITDLISKFLDRARGEHVVTGKDFIESGGESSDDCKSTSEYKADSMHTKNRSSHRSRYEKLNDKK